MSPPIEIVAAVSRNGVIGANGGIPWNLPKDLKRFAEITKGGVVVMGSLTWKSIPEKFRPLRGRRNIVLSRSLGDVDTEGAERFPSWGDALEALEKDPRNIFAIGGSRIYAKALPLARAIHLTRVHADVDGDAFFPCFDPADWKETSREDHPGFSFLRLERIQASSALSPLPALTGIFLCRAACFHPAMETLVQNPSSRYVQVDGLDAAGKSTVIDTVHGWAKARGLTVFDAVAWSKAHKRHPRPEELEGVDVLLLGEPTEVNVGARIRERLRDKETPHDARALAHLYAEDRGEHVGKVVNPFLAGGTPQRPHLIVQSRGVLSSLAFQPLDGLRLKAEPPLTAEEVLDLPGNTAALARVPDLFVFLSVSPDTAKARLAGRQEPDIFDDTGFQQALVARYRDPGLREPLVRRGTRFVELDGNAPKEQVADAFRRMLDELCPA